MRPEKSRATLQSAALSRARMFLKSGLGWLPGFPIAPGARAMEWIVIPRDDGQSIEAKTLSREDLQKAAYSYQYLVRHFPRALPRAVEDFRAWKRGVPLLLDFLKPAVQANKPHPASVLSVEGAFPPSAAGEGMNLQRQHPFLGRFINALSYALFLNPDDLSPALKWTRLHASEIRVFLTVRSDDQGLISLVSLWELSRRMRYKDTDPLIKIIGDHRALTFPTHGWSAHLSGLRQAIVDSAVSFFRLSLPAVPQPVLVDNLIAFVAWALQQTPDVRRRALELLKIVLDIDFLAPWESAWRRLAETPAAQQHIPRGLSAASAQQEIHQAEARIKALLRDVPPEVHIPTLLDDIRRFSSPHRASDFVAVCRGLRALPAIHDGVLARAAFLHDWAGLDTAACPLFAAAVRRFASYISGGQGAAALIKPWKNLLTSWTEGPLWSWSILEDILHDNREPATVEACFQALETAAAANFEGVEFAEACRLISLVRALRDPDLALKYARSLTRVQVQGCHLEDDLIRVAHALCSGGEDFGHLFVRLRELDSGAAGLESIVRLDRDLGAKGWGGIIRKAISSGEGPAIIALAARRKALASLGGTCEPPERGSEKEAPDWVRQYPPEFTESLMGLAILGPRAERTARRAFGQDFISPGALRAEIAALERKIKSGMANHGLAARLAGLRARLASLSPAFAPSKSQRIKDRLNRTVRRTVFESWTRRLDEEFLASLSKTLGISSIPRELAAPAFWPVLTSIMGLPKAFRNIALELLRRRCGPPPWNLDDHPANQAFAERISKEGIDLAPWIHPGPVQAFRAENGRILRLAFTDDPLEIFQMGAYFQTCLSPGGVNFYSTISNAADINKRVLLAKDEDGQVAGRCLFALSDHGGILTFHPYCHDNGLGFPGLVTRYAGVLASRMKTAIAARGRVERLVAPRWYDDGPRDTGFRFSYLEDGSAFRAQIQKMKTEDFLESAVKAVGPLLPNSLTLPPIIMLPELEDRPELVVPLLVLLEQCDDVPVEVWRRAADLAREAGRPDRARRILHKRIIPHLLKQLPNGSLDKGLIRLGLELDPSAILRVFRQTRPRRVKSDEEEPSYRREFIAEAHEVLGRKGLARRLREKK